MQEHQQQVQCCAVHSQKLQQPSDNTLQRMDDSKIVLLQVWYLVVPGPEWSSQRGTPSPTHHPATTPASAAVLPLPLPPVPPLHHPCHTQYSCSHLADHFFPCLHPHATRDERYHMAFHKCSVGHHYQCQMLVGQSSGGHAMCGPGFLANPQLPYCQITICSRPLLQP